MPKFAPQDLKAFHESLVAAPKEDQIKLLQSLDPEEAKQIADYSESNLGEHGGTFTETMVNDHTKLRNYGKPGEEDIQTTLPGPRGDTLATQAFGPEIGHDLATAGGAVVKGVTGVAPGLADMLHYGLRNNRITGFKDPSFAQYETTQGMAPKVRQFLTDQGAEEPTSAVGRVASAGAEAVAAGPKKWAQVLANLLGGVTAQTTAEAGGSTEAQILAGMIGSHAPMGAAQGTRQILRGDNAPTMQGNIQDYGKIGQVPSVAQALQTPGAEGLERTVAGLAGSGHAIPAFMGGQEAGIGQQARSVVRAMVGRDVTPMEAGASFVSNMKDKTTGWMDRTKAANSTGYKLYDTLVPPATLVDPAPLKSFMEGSTAPIPGLENTSTAPGIATGLGKLAPAVAADLKDKLSSVLGPDGKPINLGAPQISVGSIKALKSRVGEMVETAPIENSDNAINVRQARALYSTLSDVEKSAALKADGGKSGMATKIWEENNQKTIKYFDTLDKVRKAVNANQPEDVFRQLLNGTNEGDTKLSAAYSTLDATGKQALSAAILKNRVLKAPPTAERLSGEGFTVEQMLTNFHKLDANKDVVLNGMGPEYKRDFLNVLKVADKLRGANQEAGLYPKGGKTGLVSLIGGGLGGGMGGTAGYMLGGPTGAAAGAAAGSLGYWRSVHGLAKLMVNPTFVKWLSKTNDIPARALPMAITQLGQIASRTKDKDLAEAADEFQKAQTEGQQ